MFNSKSHNDKYNDNHIIPSINLISEGTVVNGNITSKHGFRISGEIRGTVEVEGKCIVSPTAFIDGDLFAMDADISGQIDGEIIVKNKLILRHSARVNGNIRSKIIMVEEGAVFDGACHMGSTPEKKQSNSFTLDLSENVQLFKASNE
jgi:cytoskeletal protein CcmA (bactofilin family)